MTVRKFYNDSDEMFADAEYLLEATSNEVNHLWQLHKDTLDWEDTTIGGFMVTVGELDSCPICIEISTFFINGMQVVAWSPTSMVVDYRQIEDYLKNKGFTNLKNMTNCSNFHSIVHASFEKSKENVNG